MLVGMEGNTGEDRGAEQAEVPTCIRTLHLERTRVHRDTGAVVTVLTLEEFYARTVPVPARRKFPPMSFPREVAHTPMTWVVKGRSGKAVRHRKLVCLFSYREVGMADAVMVHHPAFQEIRERAYTTSGLLSFHGVIVPRAEQDLWPDFLKP